MKTLLLSFVAMVLFSLGLLAAQIVTNLKVTPSVSRQDRVKDALRRAENLYEALKAANFDHQSFDRQFLYLPDQDFAEKPSYHNRQTPAFSVPPPASGPWKRVWNGYDGQVAFYSDIFVKMNRQHETGDKVTAHPTGDYVVCTMSGKVSLVPISSVRYVPVTGPKGDPRMYAVFPGMDQYASGVQLYQF